MRSGKLKQARTSLPDGLIRNHDLREILGTLSNGFQLAGDDVDGLAAFSLLDLDQRWESAFCQYIAYLEGFSAAKDDP